MARARRATMLCIVNARAKKLLDEAMELPEEDRAELAHELLATLDTEVEEGAEEAWAEEIERRVKRVLAGEGKSYDLDEWLARQDAKLQRAPR